MAQDSGEYNTYTNKENAYVKVENFMQETSEKENNPEVQYNDSSQKTYFENSVKCYSSVGIKVENESSDCDTKAHLANLTDVKLCDEKSTGTEIIFSQGGINVEWDTSKFEPIAKCEVENTRILFGAGKFMESGRPLTQNVQDSLTFSNEEKNGLDTKFRNQPDYVDKSALKAELEEHPRIYLD